MTFTDTFPICKSVRRIKADEQYKEEVAKRVAAKTARGSSHAPLNADNFDEAIGESMCDIEARMPHTVVALLSAENGHYVVARLFLAVATVYMEDLAEQKAVDEIANEVPA